ncbi:MAG TPA: TonB-dependent receptor [Candidatus Didemnitutus sp.]
MPVVNLEKCLRFGTRNGRARRHPGVRWTGLLAGLIAFVLSVPAFGADAAATGEVHGRVLNADNGTYLENARITLVDGNQVVYTNKFGEYRLTGVATGAQKVTAFYTGLTESTLPVTVTAGQVVTLDFNLTGTGREYGRVITLDAFVVAANRDTDQRSISVNEQRFAPNIKTVVATDQFGDITEGNVGEFVKFLPGISVGYTASDVRNISVRGVGSQYTSIMLDGSRIASADSGTIAYSATGGGTRTVELEQISINNAARIEVVKARTPDLPADALGGSLNLVSKSAFEYTHPQLSYDVLLAMNARNTSLQASPGLSSDTTSHKALPSFDLTLALPINKKFGVTFSALDSNIFNPQYRSNPQWASNGTLATVAPLPAGLATNPFLEKYTMQDGPKTTHRKAYEFTADWKISDNDVLSFRAQDNFYNNFFGNRNMNFDTGAVPPIGYSPTSTNGALGKGNVTFGSSFRNKFGVTWNLGTEFTHTGKDWAFNASANYSHASAHYHDGEEGYFSAVTYQIATTTVDYSNYNGVNPQTITVLDKTGKDTLGNVFDVRNPNYKITKVENNPVAAEDIIKTAQANVKRTFDLTIPTTIKIGVQDQFETRDVESYKIDWTPAGALALAGAVNNFGLADTTYDVLPPYIPQYPVVWPSQVKLYDLYKTNPGLFTPATAANAQNEVLGSLLFKEQIAAAYVMGDSSALHQRLRLVYGVRFEDTRDEGWGPLVQKVGATTTYVRRGSHATNDYSGAYPSVNATYNITDNLLFRASYNRAVGRPDIGNVVPNITLPDSTLTGQTIKVSNPALVAEEANNYDLSLEYYFSHVGVVSVGAFRKDFSNFWGSSNLTGPAAKVVLDDLGVPNSQDYITNNDIVTTPINVGSARVNGIELNYQQSLANIDGMADWLKNFSVFANLTGLWLKGSSNADFSAFVSETINWGLSYDTRRFGIKLNWNYRGQERDAPTTVNGVTYNEYFAPRLYLDANFEYRVGKHVSLFFNGRNLTNTPQDDLRYAPNLTPDYAHLYRREMFGTALTMGVKGTF